MQNGGLLTDKKGKGLTFEHIHALMYFIVNYKYEKDLIKNS